MGMFRGSGRWKLAAGAALGALAGAGGLAAPAATQAQATPVRHVVVIFLENHSFDSLLGYWCDDHPGRCPDGRDAVLGPAVQRGGGNARPPTRTRCRT